MDPITQVLGLASTLITRIWPDKSEVEKEKFLLELQKELDLTDLDKAQAQIDANEASNPNLFVAGWRPAVGWVCVCAFAWAYMVEPILTYFVAISGHPMPPLPKLDTQDMMTLLMAMLGMAGLRSFDKKNGTS